MAEEEDHQKTAEEIRAEVDKSREALMAENPEFIAYVNTDAGVIDVLVRSNNALKETMRAMVEEIIRLTGGETLPKHFGPLVSDFMALDSMTVYALDAYIERQKGKTDAGS